MAAVATASYAGHQLSFNSQSTRANTSNMHNGIQSQVVPQQDLEVTDDQYNTMFCRALYDYEAQDASALSFRRGDIIEILTQQPSGWWDGLLREERGWFPSNYVTIISDEEAELAFSGSEQSTVDGQLTEAHHDRSIVDMSHAMMMGSQVENEEWMENDASYQSAMQEYNSRSANHSSQPNDFWMPEVTPDGQIYYVNTQTGQRSRDLPMETDDEVSDSDLAGLTTQASSRSGTTAFGLSGSSDPETTGEAAGFGIPRHNGTPEPWVRKLADDGMSYYFYNKLNGQVQWTRPDALDKPHPISNLNSNLPDLSSQYVDASRLSVYSDSSDIHPTDYISPVRSKELNGHARQLHSSPRPEATRDAITELTAAERIAKSLQTALSPSPPEFVTDLSAAARSAIQAVISNVHAGSRPLVDDEAMDESIYGVVLAVRNLLYVSATPTSQLPTNLVPGGGRDDKDRPNSTSPLKPAQRKVTATLSRLVLSARAMQYDSGSQLGDTLNRIEADAEELEKALLSFVLEVQRTQHSADPDTKPFKRLHGVFMTANIGLGLVGAGVGGGWKGFGWLSLDDEIDAPRRPLSSEVVTEVNFFISNLENSLAAVIHALTVEDQPTDQTITDVQNILTQILSLLTLIGDIHFARHVDIDGIHQGGGSINDPYNQTVQNARHLVRTLETVLQAVYDDSSLLLMATQTLRAAEPTQLRKRDASYEALDSSMMSLKSNLAMVQQIIEALLSAGHHQADVAQGDYNGSIEWRLSRLSVINDQFGGSVRLGSDSVNIFDDVDPDGFVDLETALNRVGGKMDRTPPNASFDSRTTLANSSSDLATTSSQISESLYDRTIVSNQLDGEASSLYDDEVPLPPKNAPRPAGANKLHKILGDEYADKVAAELQPWYLRPNYNPAEISIDDSDNSVRAGTVSALVERLTAHEHADTTFNKAFLMTYKSFTTLDELFDLLIERFRIQPPVNLTSGEREEWGKLKQHIIQMRVINTFKSMITDEDVLEKEDMYILDRMKDFISSDEVSRFGAAKSLLILIERSQRGGDGLPKMVTTSQGPIPTPILPKTTKKLKLLDIEPLELARQLTIMESQLYQRIKPMECLQRSREQKTENADNITAVIQTSNRIADWVAESILNNADSRRRAQAVKHMIMVADRCRTLNNFSTMIAITSGLNTPPIRRLKRTWEQVNQRVMAQFGACEMTIDTNKNFTKYRQLMANVTPPCVPFIGVFLSTLQFIQDGNPDNLPGGLVNFRKRQKASEVINDIKRWQAQPFNLQQVPSILAFIEESLNQFTNTKASSEHFWALSLEREPREREDEKMARLLQESGFL